MEQKNKTWIIYLIIGASIFILGGFGGWFLRGYISRGTVDEIRSEYADTTDRLDKLTKYTTGLEQLLADNDKLITEYREQVGNLTESNTELQSIYDNLTESNESIRAELERAKAIHDEDILRSGRDLELIRESREIIRQIKQFYGVEDSTNK